MFYTQLNEFCENKFVSAMEQPLFIKTAITNIYRRDHITFDENYVVFSKYDTTTGNALFKEVLSYACVPYIELEEGVENTDENDIKVQTMINENIVSMDVHPIKNGYKTCSLYIFYAQSAIQSIMMLPTNILPGNNFYEVYKCYCKQAQNMHHSDVLYRRLVEYFKSNHITVLDTHNSTIAVNIITHDLMKRDNEKTDIQSLNYVLTQYTTLACKSTIQTSDALVCIDSTPFSDYSLHSLVRLLDTAIIRETNIHQFVIAFIADTIVIFTYMNFMRARKHIKLLVSTCAFENRIKELMQLELKLQDATTREEALKAEVESLKNVLAESPDADKNEKIKQLEQTNKALEKQLEGVKGLDVENTQLKNDVSILQTRVNELEKSNAELKQDNEYYAALVPTITKKRA